LAGSSGSFVTTYIYDAANRLQFSLSGGQLTTYTWDLRGNLTSDGSQSYTYDQANRLVEVYATPGPRIWYAAYNGNPSSLRSRAGGARVWTSYQSGRSPTIVTDDILDLAAPLPVVLVKGDPRWPGLDTPMYYVYAQGTSPLAEYNSNPDPIIGGEGEWTYYLPDGLGSVRQEVSADGEVLTERRFDPYGVPLDGDSGTPFGYTGEQYDADTGLLFLRARYLQTELGMFMSRDPVLTSSPYRYASSNPINRVDPSGYIDCSIAQIENGRGQCRVNEWGESVFGIARRILETGMTGLPYTEENVVVVAGQIAQMNQLPPSYELKYWQLLELKAEWIEALRGSYSYLPVISSNYPPSPPVSAPSQPLPSTPGQPSAQPAGPPGWMPNGYLEGRLFSVTDMFCPIFLEGEEVVYDFASMPPQRARFTYKILARSFEIPHIGTIGVGGLSTSEGDVTLAGYFGIIGGFSRDKDITEYSGPFLSWSVGGSTPVSLVGAGLLAFRSPNGSMYGGGGYFSGGIGFATPFNVSFTMADYSIEGRPTLYGSKQKVSYSDLGRLTYDIGHGMGSPLTFWGYGDPALGGPSLTPIIRNSVGFYSAYYVHQNYGGSLPLW
jgi:RHS repeat-associated protein